MDRIEVYGITFESKDIIDLTTVTNSSISGSELVVDQCLPTVQARKYILKNVLKTNQNKVFKTSDGKVFQLQITKPLIQDIPYGSKLVHYHNNKLAGVYYVSASPERISADSFSIEAVSDVGILEKSTHLGGVYSGQKFKDVAADILGGSVKFTCTSDVADIAIYGWLPIANRRSNLHQLLFACGVFIRRDSEYNIVFTFIDSLESTEISTHNMANGGSIDSPSDKKAISLIEHAYISPVGSVQPVVLFDNSENASLSGDNKVYFEQAPIFRLYTEGDLRIKTSSVNYAIVSGVGVLYGIPYTHTTRSLEYSTEEDVSDEETLTSTECTLVNVVNSQKIMDRLKSYYMSKYSTTMELIDPEVQSGALITYTNPFLEKDTGFLTRMETIYSGIQVSKSTILNGYTPTKGGNNYSNVIKVTSSGTVSIPDSVDEIMIVLISGGHGGYLGNPGEQGKDDWSSHNHATKGGEPGNPGEGGRVLITSLSLTGSHKFSVVIGTGGKGQTTSTDATDGTATTFDEYTSANGSVFENGYIDVLSGEIFAVKGGQGISGGHGQDSGDEGTNVIWNGITYVPGAQGKTVTRKSGDQYAEGGYGGGPAVGANGENGRDGRFSGTNHFAEGGVGGDGATPIKAPNGTIPGQGGYGGHGGGGGGAGGNASGPSSSEEQYGRAGYPGPGGEGGDGASGILLIYY